ncbi:sugar ABC transporter permease [Isoptericola sp. b441]|uniref:Sugar ABC transporter permease n=1 Tax=Actinotalea lenta TaxID=3064654 RepID=A0ABT9D774_9CELL|nr:MULTISPECIES: sugar ABC transporter permease [unclassified Isoptericola]MDO8106697.1 sugar ABC transporter permease [Isoptericola sp. b441]MDO8121591.1 sugar ABC transporter permease [Isoptericola sp. b490]
MTTSLATGVAAPSRSPRARSRDRRRPQRRLVFLLPAALFLGIFSLYPLVQLLRMSVSDVTARTLNSPWSFVGLDNFTAGFSSGQTTQALVRTLVFVGVVTLLGMVGGLAGAIALRTRGRWSGLLLAVMVFVWALPPVVNGSVWKFLLGDAGLINTVLLDLGLRQAPAPFLYDQYWALMSVAFVNAFAVIPFNALVFRAALMNIEPETFEAAALDGANRWQEIRHIMLPAVRATTLVLLVLTVVYGFRSFDFIYVMTYGGPGTATNTLPFLGYLQAFVRYDFGLGAATSVVTVLGVLVLAVVYARSIRREEAES